MPELILDTSKCLANIEKMAGKAKHHKLSFRPHCKTHQSAEIAGWFRDFGVEKITVSSFRMADYFVKHGWKDVLVAFPFNPQDTALLGQLSAKSRISLLLDSEDAVSHLKAVPHQVDFYIDMDAGYGRTGVAVGQITQIERIIKASHKTARLMFAGFYCHAGNSYKTITPEERERIHLKAVGDLLALKNHFDSYEPKILYGDTPNCSTQDHFTGVDEITPGNFVFYDLIQRSIGSCRGDHIAVAMSCPVATKYPSGRRIVIHGGAVHFSKESLVIGDTSVFGEIAAHKESGWTDLEEPVYLSAISKEHGIIEKSGKIFERVRPGDNLYVLPVHSCLTANLMRSYKTLQGGIVTTLNSE